MHLRIPDHIVSKGTGVTLLGPRNGKMARIAKPVIGNLEKVILTSEIGLKDK